MIVTPMDIIIILFLSFIIGILSVIVYLELEQLENPHD
jgi:hypothetical protein